MAVFLVSLLLLTFLMACAATAFRTNPVRINIISPRNGAVVSGEVLIRGSFSGQIKKIEVSIDRGPWYEAKVIGRYISNRLSSHRYGGNWKYIWNATDVSEQTHKISVRGEKPSRNSFERAYIYDSIYVKVEKPDEQVGWLHGQVRGSTGDSFPYPLKNATVSVKYIGTTNDINEWKVTHTNKYGYYQIAVKPGFYKIKAHKKQYSTEVKYNISIEANENRTVNFYLRQENPDTGNIEGKVVDGKTGAPIRNARIFIQPRWSHHSPVPIYTNQNGFFKTEKKQGDYLIEVYKHGYQKSKKKIRLHPGEDKKLYFKLHELEENTVKIDEWDAGKRIYVKPGSLINLTLQANPSTGFQWKITKLNPAKIRLIKHFFWKQNAFPHLNPRLIGCGAPCKETWMFKTVNTGRTTLELTFLQPWARHNHHQKTFSVTLIIPSIPTPIPLGNGL